MINPADGLYKFKNMNLPAVISAARIRFLLRSIGFWYICSKTLYNVITIVASNVAGCIALQGIAEMTTLLDNTIDEMQFRCFLASALHSQASTTYILTPNSSFYVT